MTANTGVAGGGGVADSPAGGMTNILRMECFQKTTSMLWRVFIFEHAALIQLHAGPTEKDQTQLEVKGI